MNNINAMSNESFAYYTIKQRLPKIVNDIIKVNSLAKSQVIALESIIADIKLNKTVDIEIFNDMFREMKQYFSKYAKQSWFEAPFFIVEMYFYYRILAAIDYPHCNSDPFKKVKTGSLEKELLKVNMADELFTKSDSMLHSLITQGLWSNNADLSQLKSDRAQIDSHDDRVLIDDRKAMIEYFKVKRGRVDFIADNAGIELFSDILLALYLLKNDIVGKVIFHLKKYPIFVSDATIEDFYDTLAFLRDNSTLSNELLDSINSYLSSGKLVLGDAPFWAYPLHFFDFPAEIEDSLKGSDLLILKGDLNYRRFLGDKSWPYTAPIKSINSYNELDVLLIRTLKSEIMVNLTGDKVEELFHIDPDWLVNGNYGIIQFIQRNHKKRH